MTRSGDSTELHYYQKGPNKNEGGGGILASYDGDTRTICLIGGSAQTRSPRPQPLFERAVW
jgi:hypothetical protein